MSVQNLRAVDPNVPPPQVSLGTLNECVWRVYIGSELRGDKDFSSWAHGPPGGQ